MRDATNNEAKRHPLLAAIDKVRLAESLPPDPPAIVGVCGNCRRDVYFGGAILFGRGVYCATEGCVLAALGHHGAPNQQVSGA